MWPVLPVEADCPPLQLEAAAGAHQAAVVEGEARAQAQGVVRPHHRPAPSTAAASGHLLGSCVVIELYLTVNRRVFKATSVDHLPRNAVHNSICH